MSEDADVRNAWFTSDGSEIQGTSNQYSSVHRWEIIEDGESSIPLLQPLGEIAYSPGALPWESSYGYEVTDDGWILSSAQNRLLWLPHHWRSQVEYRKWSRRFLGLSHLELPEVIILELLD